MIQSAKGASPLEGNLRELARLLDAGQSGSPVAGTLAGWAAEALRRAGAESVHTEKLMSRTGGPAEIQAVVGEVRGREKPDEFVLLSAHLDTRIPNDSPADDPADAAVVIDAARVIHASGSSPRRSIRFVLFTGTRQGQPGSRAYVAAHALELDRTDAAIFLSVGNKPIAGYSLSGRSDILTAVQEAVAPARTLGVKEFTLDAELRPDSLDFLLEGIPALVASRSPDSNVPRVRTDTGTLDAATLAELKRHVAIAALTAYALADAPQRIGPRQSRDRIGQLLRDTSLEQKMKREGLWPDWESGERGRPRSD